MNKKPKITVIDKPWIDSFLLPETILWWAQVTVAPELNNKAVFNKGIEKGFKGLIPLGGHITPISTEGAKLLWKKAQKKDKKNNISETINKIKPNFNPDTANLVWKPWKVDSLITSFNHINKHVIKINKPNKNKNIWL